MAARKTGAPRSSPKSGKPGSKPKPKPEAPPPPEAASETADTDPSEVDPDAKTMLPDSEPDEKDKPKDKPKLKPNMCSDCSEAMRMSELPVYFREAGEPDRILHPGCFARTVLPKKRKLYPRALLVFCRACSVTSISFNGKTCSACQSNRVNSVS